jgi:primosomal protein N'
MNRNKSEGTPTYRARLRATWKPVSFHKARYNQASMSAASLPSPNASDDPLYCDVSLPVPMDQAFTYKLPLTLRHRVAVGCRVLVPFGTRQLAGVVIAAHNNPPSGSVREALQLLDEEPALDEGLLKLGRWIAQYYCAPLGETLRAMTPLANDVKRSKTYTLTTAGRDAARQLLLGADTEDPALQILRLLEAKPLTSAYLTQKIKRTRKEGLHRIRRCRRSSRSAACLGGPAARGICFAHRRQAAQAGA